MSGARGLTLGLAALGLGLLLAEPLAFANSDDRGVKRSCQGHPWVGSMSNGNRIHFEIDLKQGRLEGWQPVPSSLHGTKCVQSFGGHQRTYELIIPSPSHGSAVNGGRFSFTVERDVAPLPVVRWHASGKLNGTHASGTFNWRIVKSRGAVCTPSQGSLSWTATRRPQVVVFGR